jgi:hypothetical protein
LQEVQSLGQQGKLTTNRQVLLTVSAEGGDSVPVNGPHETVAQHMLLEVGAGFPFRLSRSSWSHISEVRGFAVWADIATILF